MMLVSISSRLRRNLKLVRFGQPHSRASPSSQSDARAIMSSSTERVRSEFRPILFGLVVEMEAQPRLAMSLLSVNMVCDSLQKIVGYLLHGLLERRFKCMIVGIK